MTWKADDPQGDETAKVRFDVVPYTRGKGLDLGCGVNKLWPNGSCIGVDNYKDLQLFNIQARPDVVQDVVDLSIFASNSMDYVYSSHVLEHFKIEKVPEILREWFRVVKHGGYVTLYLPDEATYPRVGEPGANIDHKWNVDFPTLLAAVDRAGVGYELVDFERRNSNREYSLLFVFKKNKNPHKADSSAWNSKRNKRGLYADSDDATPLKRAAVVRYGAIGDTIQASSVCAALKKQGYHVTFFGTFPATEVVAFDPNIDHIHVQGFDQLPNEWLGAFFQHHEAKFDKWVNLTEAAEANLLAVKGNIRYQWPAPARHRVMNHNYLELQHLIAGVPYEPVLKFYPTVDEINKAANTRSRLESNGATRIVMWALAGSGRVHKLWPYTEQVIKNILGHCPHAGVITTGDAAAAELEPDWEHKRLVKTCGKATIREVLAMLHGTYGKCGVPGGSITEHPFVDVLVGPETGVLNAGALLPIPKVIFLSHSTPENLTRDWVNTAALYAPTTHCPGRGANEAPACHMMHPTFDACRQHEETKVAQCCAEIKAEWAWAEIYRAIRAGKVTSPWSPPTS